ncbi:MAG: hypothetical protein ACK5C0_13665 [Candidatus Kapaibacterium sp.]
MWEKYRGQTPFHYCGNNPLIYRDPSGLGEEEVNNAAQKVQETMTQIETLAEQNKEKKIEFAATGVNQADGSVKMSDIVRGNEGEVTTSVSDVDVSIHNHTPYGQPTTASPGDILKLALYGKQGSIHFVTAGDGNRVAVEINDVEAARTFANNQLRVGEVKAVENLGYELAAGMMAVGGKPKNLSIADIPTNLKSKGVAKILDQNDTGMSIYVQNKGGTYEKK